MLKFYLCSKCGNLVELVREGGGNLVCCDTAMNELKPNTVDAAHEKHVPVVAIDGDKVNVQVGSVLHPMTNEHYIQFIYVATKNTVQRVKLNPGDEPKASFTVHDKGEIDVYAYCNLHGLWLTKLTK